jgi:hypothetical protein
VVASLLDPGERDKLSREPQLPTDGTLEEFLGQFAALDEAESGLLRGRSRRGSVASGSRRGSAREGAAGAWSDTLTARSDANPGEDEEPHSPHSPSRSPSLAWDGAGGDEPLSPGSPSSVGSDGSDGSASSEEPYHAANETPETRAYEVQ